MSFPRWICRLLLLPLLACTFTAAGGQASKTRTMALTIDDLPLAIPGNDRAPGELSEAQRVTAALLKTLAAHHAPAIGFVNEIKVNVANQRDARAALLSDWLQAGMDLGNHTYSHLMLSEVGISRYEDDIVRGTTITSAEIASSGRKERYFRYPYADTGKDKKQKDAIIAFYTARGFINAPVTVQNQDWMLNAPYTEALARQDTAKQKQIVAAYLQHTNDELAYAEALSRQSFGREIPQVMLLHADALNADHLDAVLSLMEEHGYRFVTLDEALRDAAYATRDDYVGPDGITWLERWQIALGKPFHPNEPSPPKWAQDDYRRITGSEP